MTYQVEALVLSAVKWGESDKIVKLLTAERGQVRALAFGARRAKSPLAATLQPFNRIEITLTEGQKIDTVRRASLVRAYRKIGDDLTAMAYGSFVTELVGVLVPEGEPAETAFGLLENVFAALEERNPRVVALAAAWQFLRLAGLGPEFSRCRHCGKPIETAAFYDIAEGGAICGECRFEAAKILPLSLKEMIERLYNLSFATAEKFSLSKNDFLEAEKILLSYLNRILDQPLKSLQFINEL